VKVETARLTTCEVGRDGKTIALGVVDTSGCATSIHLTFDQAQSLVMTLPRLLTAALQRFTHNPDTRYVFPLGTWRISLADDRRNLVLSQMTPDGFEVSFSLPHDEAQILGNALSTEGAATNLNEPMAAKAQRAH